MAYRIVRTMRRPESTQEHFRQRIPTDVLDKARGRSLAIPVGSDTVVKTIGQAAREVKLSLRTGDRKEAKIRNAQVAAYLEAFWQSLREEREPTKLTHKQAVALAGEFYRAFTEAFEDDPGPRERWLRTFGANLIADSGYSVSPFFGTALDVGRETSMEARFGPMVDTFLARRALFVDADSRSKLIEQFFKAGQEMAEGLRKKSDGDYSPDTAIQRFPTWDQASPDSPTARRDAVSITGLLEGWWAEVRANKSPKTYEAFEKAVRYLVAFLGHDDATRVTKRDIVNFKDHRLQQTNPRTGKPLSANTVRDGDLAGLKVVFDWAVANLKLPENPATGVTIRHTTKARVRTKSFSTDEQTAILSAAAAYTGGREQPKTALAKRWVPWLCAYTGARVGEMVQLRKEDVFQADGVWVLRITPEAGDVKTKAFRLVPIHDHLLERGFLEVVYGAAAGHLFLSVSGPDDLPGKRQTVKNRLTTFIRSVVPDPNVQPNHGWRHTFKTLGLRARIQERILDQLQGHAPKTAGEQYGDPDVQTLAQEMKRYPRYPV